ncbi:MAG: S41 family peptidase [Acidobacteriota bacterium]|nr:S41 family peptidase [Acidobacteriota bacterium]
MMKQSIKPALFALLALTLTFVSTLAQQTSSPVSASTIQKTPVNLDFERGTAGKVPVGWESPTRERGYAAETADKMPRTGTKAAVLRSEPDAVIDARSFGNLMQAIDAAPFRGKRMRLRGAVRVEADEAGARAQLWTRVDRTDGKLGFFDNMGDRPITSAEWQFYEIVGDVEEDAKILNLGMILIGRGKAYLDDVSIEDLGKTVFAAQPPHPITKRGLENVIAFTRLLGYARHFHPSDEAAAIDWDVFAIEGIRSVEGAKNAAELARKLETLFLPVAPTVRVYRTGKRPLSLAFKPPRDSPQLKIVSWRHQGFGQKSPNQIYKSERVYQDAPAANVSSQSTDLLQPVIADLGGGVSCLVPLVLFADSSGTLPKTTSANSVKNVNRPKYSGIDRATRLADVALAWNIFQHFYPYFDVVQTDWSQTLTQSLKSAATDADGKMFARTLRLMVAQLRDGHGRVQFGSRSEIELLPIMFGWIENRLVITNVAEGTDGVQPGDIVMSIDGKPGVQALAEVESLVSSATTQYKRHVALRELREGEKNSQVKLEVRDASGQTRTIVLRRSVEAQKLTETRPAKVEEIKSGVFYLDLDRITDEDFKAALPKLEKAQGIVFDLRGYPRSVSPLILQHLTDKTINSAHFIVPLITTPDHQNINEFTQDGRWTLPPKTPRLTAKIAFLIDGRAISYAESYMGIVEAYKLAEIVGEPSAGTNGNINPFTLPGGYNIVWTGMKVLKHDNSPHHGIGIKPTIPISRTIQGVRERRDEQLERAITAVSKAQ